MKDEYLPKIYYHELFQVVLVLQTQTRVPANLLQGIISTTCIPYFAKIGQMVQKN